MAPDRTQPNGWSAMVDGAKSRPPSDHNLDSNWKIQMLPTCVAIAVVVAGKRSKYSRERTSSKGALMP